MALTADVATAARIEEAALQAQHQAEKQAQKQAPKRNSSGSSGTTRSKSKKEEKKNQSHPHFDPVMTTTPSSGVSAHLQTSTASLTSTPDMSFDPLVAALATTSPPPPPHHIVSSSSSSTKAAATAAAAAAALVGSSSAFSHPNGTPITPPDVYPFSDDHREDSTKENGELPPLPLPLPLQL